MDSRDYPRSAGCADWVGCIVEVACNDCAVLADLEHCVGCADHALSSVCCDDVEHSGCSGCGGCRGRLERVGCGDQLGKLARDEDDG